MGFRVLTNLIKYKILVCTISSKRYGKYSINIHSRYITDGFLLNQIAVVLTQTKLISLY